MPQPPLDRRTFLKGASAAAVLPLITPAWASPRRADPLKIGVIGLGGRGTGAAIQALTADTDSVLWAVGDVFPDRMNGSLKGIESHLAEQGQTHRLQLPPERRFLGFDAYRHVIDSDVDVVLLTAYPQFRPAHMEYAVAQGKHVFAEKPIAVDAPGVRRVLAASEAARAKKLTVVSGFCWRYANAEKAAFAKLHEGVIGPVLSVHSTYHTSTLPKRPRKPEWSDMEFQLRNWWHFTWVSGDHIVEQAIHSLDRMSWAMNDEEPLRCVALGGRAAREGPEHGHAYDHFTVIYEYANGRRAFHTTRQIDNCPSDNSDYIQGTLGRATINGFANRQEFTAHDGTPLWSYDGPRGDMYQNEHDALFKSIRANAAHNDGHDMCRSTMLAIMGRMAAYTGATVSWKQAWDSQEDLTPSALAFGPLPTPPIAIPGKTKLL
jgi:myo-inositol 2-dehydrogenase/D-chiro-inositol 1-dehydrogenase